MLSLALRRLTGAPGQASRLFHPVPIQIRRSHEPYHHPYHCSFVLVRGLPHPSLRADRSYRVEHVEVPEGVVMEVSGMDYSADGVLYLCDPAWGCLDAEGWSVATFCPGTA